MLDPQRPTGPERIGDRLLISITSTFRACPGALLAATRLGGHPLRWSSALEDPVQAGLDWGLAGTLFGRHTIGPARLQRTAPAAACSSAHCAGGDASDEIHPA